jgi:hypothetical protein
VQFKHNSQNGCLRFAAIPLTALISADPRLRCLAAPCRPREEILKERGVDAALLDLDPGPRQYISTGNQGTRASRAGSVTSGDEHGPGDQWTTVGKQGRPRPKWVQALFMFLFLP